MAGLIPQTFIDDLLSRADIVEVVDKRVTLRKSGKNYSACCPFHKEKTPSFSVQTRASILLLLRLRSRRQRHRLHYELRSNRFSAGGGISCAGQRHGSTHAKKMPQQPAGNRRTASYSKSLAQASKFYCQQLRRHAQRKSAVDYLKARGVSGEVARDFCIGYAPPGWDNLLKSIAADANEQNCLLKAGMVVEKEARKDESRESGNTVAVRYYDRFRDRIIFPYS